MMKINNVIGLEKEIQLGKFHLLLSNIILSFKNIKNWHFYFHIFELKSVKKLLYLYPHVMKLNFIHFYFNKCNFQILLKKKNNNMWKKKKKKKKKHL